MKRPHARISLGWLMAIVVWLAIPLFWISQDFRERTERVKFQGLANRLKSEVQSLESRLPAGMDPAIWRNAVGQTELAVGAVCFYGSIHNTEMAGIVSEMEARTQTEVGPETLLWVWHRLERASRSGWNYNRLLRINMLSELIGEALRRNRPEGEDAESWRRYVQSIEVACRDAYHRTAGEALFNGGPCVEADVLLNDLDSMLQEASRPGAAKQIMDRLATEQNNNP